ncbi:phosphoglycerate mutase-like protein [Whalleya microplaca]|nr:phosphoglycerate mutase-like protein [Whalleya microplaca]
MVFAGVRHRLTALMAGRQYRYTALPENGTRDHLRKQATGWVHRHITAVRLFVCASLSVVIILFSMSVMGSISSRPCTGFMYDRQCRKEISRSWGQYTSTFAVPSRISPAVPKDCKVTFAQLLSRHGARDPTAGKTLTYASIINRIHDGVTEYGKGFEFIKDYKYTLGADQLTLFGQWQMMDSGIDFYHRYEKLAKTVSPFIRASGQERVIESASNWTQGFHKARLADKDSDSPDAYPYDMVIIPEETGFNNSLSPNLCPSFEDSRHSGPAEQDNWLDRFIPPITERLNQNLPGANLTDEDTISFMDLCPFNTAANDEGKLSAFCHLFTVEEWHSYDYYQSLGKWYSFGNGSPLGPTQGVGFVNELLARLTDKPVDDHTTTNTTLDESNATFPLGSVLYADFSHDNDMMDIFAALGLYNATSPLPDDRGVDPKETKGFSASWVVPFAARLYVEKMACAGVEEELVRILVNDRVIPLQNCSADELGRCTLSRFVDSQSFARQGGHWDLCFD